MWHVAAAGGASPAAETTVWVDRIAQAGLLGGHACRIHVNPDCGLKTRRWDEVIPALRNMVAAAELCRAELGGAEPHTPTKAPAAEGPGAAADAPAAPAGPRRASCGTACCLP